jgi:hypothetical protein
MKPPLRLFLALLPVLLVPVLALVPWRVSGDDAVAAKLLALFSQFDADHNGLLSPEEQARAVDQVKTTYGDKWAQQVQTMFGQAASPDKSISTANWSQQVAAYAHGAAKQTAMVAMRDGVHLATDFYLPTGNGPFPVILSRTPYDRLKGQGGASGLTGSAYVYVIQDMRGRFASEGENLPFIGCGWSEHQDGVDTIAWLRQQPWCNGKIGTVGGSALGITQNLVAGAAPEGLTAQFLSVAAASLYSDATYTGGAFRKIDTENWAAENKFDPRAASIIRSHPSYDDYWKQFDTSLKFDVMNVPAVHNGGWFDIFTQGVLDEFVGRQHHGAPGSRGAQKLVMGPWTHSLGKMPVGELTFPHSAMPSQISSARWFAHYLQGQENGVEREPAVTYYVMGDTSSPGAPGNEWRHADDWPIPATETPFYFSRDRLLIANRPADVPDSRVEYTFDPSNPCPTIGGNNLTIARGPMNQNAIENRSDVVSFTTEPLALPIEVTGRVTAEISISSSAVDTDLSVRLCDVYPDGKSYLIAEGMRRLRYRHSLEKPELLTPGKIEQVTVDCWSTSIIFNKGHQIRATITSSNYPRFDLNPGTGEQWSVSGAKVKQTNHIGCDFDHQSFLLLPVVTTQRASQ